MSDEFDKEAEREKLREKYGDDEEDRKATERMSDLLLKGATMTNTHCGTCGDPLFRQNGVTFCPSCHGGPEGVEGAGVEGAEEQTQEQGRSPAEPEGGGGATEIDVSSPGEAGNGDEGPNAGPAEGPAGQSDSSGTGERATPSGRTEPGMPDRDRRSDRESPRAPRSRGSAADQPDTPTAPVSDAPAGGSGTDARGSLLAALERFSAEAAATDDPRYARECLEAAREAAEALAALR